MKHISVASFPVFITLATICSVCSNVSARPPSARVYADIKVRYADVYINESSHRVYFNCNRCGGGKRIHWRWFQHPRGLVCASFWFIGKRDDIRTAQWYDYSETRGWYPYKKSSQCKIDGSWTI